MSEGDWREVTAAFRTVAHTWFKERVARWYAPVRTCRSNGDGVHRISPIRCDDDVVGWECATCGDTKYDYPLWDWLAEHPEARKEQVSAR